MCFDKQITCIITVSALLLVLAQHLQNSDNELDRRLFSIRTLCTAGKSRTEHFFLFELDYFDFGSLGEDLSPQTAIQFVDLLTSIAASYSMCEVEQCTIIEAYHHIANTDLHSFSIPLGRLFGDFTSRILAERSQPAVLSKLSELFITGLGIFRDYLNRPHLTREVLIELDDGNTYYQTVDFIRVNPNVDVLNHVE